jgi:hypothetical protein
MGPIKAEYDEGKFKVSAGGVDVDFEYEQLVDYVSQARARGRESSWYDVLSDVAHRIAVTARRCMAGAIDLDGVAAVVLASLSLMFNTFLDKMINAAFEIIDYGIGLVMRFFDWLFGLFC